MSSFDEYKKILDDIYFSALKGRVYHHLRANFLESWHRWSVCFLSLSLWIFSIEIVRMLNSVEPIYSLFLDTDSLAFYILFSIFLIFLVVLIFTRHFRHHEELSRKWKHLVLEINKQKSAEKTITKSDCERFVKEHNQIVKEEFEIYLGLDALAYNIVCRDYGYNKYLIIPWHVYRLKNFWKFSNKIRLFESSPKPLMTQKAS